MLDSHLFLPVSVCASATCSARLCEPCMLHMHALHRLFKVELHLSVGRPSVRTLAPHRPFTKTNKMLVRVNSAHCLVRRRPAHLGASWATWCCRQPLARQVLRQWKRSSISRQSCLARPRFGWQSAWPSCWQHTVILSARLAAALQVLATACFGCVCLSWSFRSLSKAAVQQRISVWVDAPFSCACHHALRFTRGSTLQHRHRIGHFAGLRTCSCTQQHFDFATQLM